MNCNMQSDRRLVHRALEALLDADATRDDYQDVQLRREVIKDLRKVLDARDEQMPNKDTSQVPEGFVLLQTEKGKPIYAACLDGGRFHGWLMWKHPDGQWVSKRKLEQWEIMQAEDQRDYGIVQGD